MQTPHETTDLNITLVDGLPPSLPIREAVKPAIRLRMESLWIDRLQAELNTKRQWRSSFPGGAAARRTLPQAASPQQPVSQDSVSPSTILGCAAVLNKKCEG